MASSAGTKQGRGGGGGGADDDHFPLLPSESKTERRGNSRASKGRAVRRQKQQQLQLQQRDASSSPSFSSSSASSSASSSRSSRKKHERGTAAAAAAADDDDDVVARADIARPPFPLYGPRVDGGNGSGGEVRTKEGRVRDPSFREALAGVSSLFRGRRNILVLVGAGISVSCGIPDFRSRGTGLYSTLDAEELGLNDPQELFDLEVFREDPRPFYRFAKNLYPGSVSPSVSHRFLALLHRRGMLLRVYTQNIDGLEEVAGVPKPKVVHAHGSLSWAQCTKCRKRLDSSEIADDVKRGTVPRCGRPSKNGGGGGGGGGNGGELKRKNSADSAEPMPALGSSSRRIRRKTVRMMESNILGSSISNASDWERGNGAEGTVPSFDADTDCDPVPICGGVIKPGVTFFGEKLDDRVRRRLEADREKADCLVVIGTSLSVAPMSKVIQYLKPSIPRILINRNVVKAPKSTLEDQSDDAESDFRDNYVFDACLLGFCDSITRALASKIGSRDDVGHEGEKQAVPVTQEGKVLCNVEDEYADRSGIIHGLHNYPTERVLLFPGAVLDNGDSDSDITYKEVAHCDGCHGQIEGSIMKCEDCFDYDLCMACFPKISRIHHCGKHKFVSER